ncbi:hypothetical protein [uncultured Subdoligranulum sp.]|uniref:hypothetical protein n=1 Tax=uncultured Subdoligranulum sp. TaxID=512298 RepID=UPI00261798A9|nr:hypothetical protein [uncultured Subdoligranulum sp.]
MTAKKDPGRFTVRFNLQDPSHRKVVAILEQQGARNKANYLANAVLCYENAAPQSMGKALVGFSRSDIESVVWEILEKWQPKAELNFTDAPDIAHNIAPSGHQQKASNQGDALGLISDALAAFQSG